MMNYKCLMQSLFLLGYLAAYSNESTIRNNQPQIFIHNTTEQLIQLEPTILVARHYSIPYLFSPATLNVQHTLKPIPTSPFTVQPQSNTEYSYQELLLASNSTINIKNV